MKIQKINRGSTILIQKVALEALREAMKPFDVEVQGGRGKFDTGVVATIEFNFTKVGGKEPIAVAFERYAKSFGLEPDDLGRSFNNRGEAFTIVGLKMKGKGSRSRPIVAENEAGARYLFTAAEIKALLKAAA